MCNVTEDGCRSHQSVLAISSRHTPNIFKFRKLKRHEVLAALKGVNPNKTTGYDIPPRVLKMKENYSVPNAWKRVVWISIHKTEDPLNKAYHRSVTALIAVDKIFEQLICKQLSELFEPIFDPFLSA